MITYGRETKDTQRTERMDVSPVAEASTVRPPVLSTQCLPVFLDGVYSKLNSLEE